MSGRPGDVKWEWMGVRWKQRAARLREQHRESDMAATVRRQLQSQWAKMNSRKSQENKTRHLTPEDLRRLGTLGDRFLAWGSRRMIPFDKIGVMGRALLLS
ncbi:hypothetical protein H920_19895 [Fukomys damarensis]|uniref:Uncharacterized protein n=1 Tax=Fukomys damarensis TaxID=885580 RepID=A0A091CJI4_FUKDA|nr:hypothetical protein H920_19895 [Fukomys damarensis]